MWKDIASAPLDGTWVDLWIVAKGGQFRATDFRWNGTFWAHKHTDMIMNESFSNVEMKATHWMPVPPNPL